MYNAAPVQLTDRATILDALRGFAILGILLDNVLAFTGYGFFTMEQREALPTFDSDIILFLAERTFIQGKFYSLFSLLFGIGFSIILLRNVQKGVNPLRLFYRRLLVLLIIGLLHMVLLWPGDILVVYALTGCLLPLFRKCSDRGLLIWAAVLILSPILVDGIKVLLETPASGFLKEMARETDQKLGIPSGEGFSKYLFRDGSGWDEWRNWQASGYLHRFAYLIEKNRPPKVLGMFLIGLYAGRKMIYVRLEQYTSLFKKIRRWGFVMGIPSCMAMAYFDIDGKAVPAAAGLWDTIFYATGVMPLCLAYVATICLYWIKTKGRNRFASLAPAGRMALSNYLFQSIACIFIFYGAGLGLGGDMGPTLFFPIALGVYLFQVVFSNWWLRFFNYGLLEWFWRILTYGRWLPFWKNK